MKLRDAIEQALAGSSEGDQDRPTRARDGDQPWRMP